MVSRADVIKAIRDYLASVLVEKRADASEWPKFSTVTGYLAYHYPTADAWAEFGMAMQRWEVYIQSAFHAGHDHCLVTVPAGDARAEEVQRESERYRVRIWHLSCAADASLRGPAPTHTILQNVERFLSQGCPTHQYPVKVFFDMFGLSSGEVLPSFKIGICEGMSTVTACFLIAHCLVNMDAWPNFQGNQADVLNALSMDILSIFHLTVVDGGSGLNITAKIQRSLGGKLDATERIRPSPLEMYRAFRHRATELVAHLGHLVQDQVWTDVIMEFHQFAVGRHYFLTTEEVSCIKLLAMFDAELRDMIEAGDVGGRVSEPRLSEWPKHLFLSGHLEFRHSAAHRHTSEAAGLCLSAARAPGSWSSAWQQSLVGYNGLVPSQDEVLGSTCLGTVSSQGSSASKRAAASPEAPIPTVQGQGV